MGLLSEALVLFVSRGPARRAHRVLSVVEVRSLDLYLAPLERLSLEFGRLSLEVGGDLAKAIGGVQLVGACHVGFLSVHPATHEIAEAIGRRDVRMSPHGASPWPSR